MWRYRFVFRGAKVSLVLSAVFSVCAFSNDVRTGMFGAFLWCEPWWGGISFADGEVVCALRRCAFVAANGLSVSCTNTSSRRSDIRFLVEWEFTLRSFFLFLEAPLVIPFHT